MHRFEDGCVCTDVGSRRHAEATHQAGHEVRKDVTKQVGGDQHVELPGVEHQFHRAGIDDDGLKLELALVLALVQLFARFQKDAGERFHDVGLVHDGDLLAARGNGVVKGELQQPAAPRAGVDAGGNGHGMWIAIDLHVMLVADVQAF